MVEERKTCFVITPIGAAGSLVRRKIDGLIDEVIEPVLSELGYKVIVSHRISESGTMTAAIIQNVYNSDLVIANLTGNNPNVMYEVALRHASAKPIIHISEKVSDLPFDVNDQRTIEYADDMFGARDLKAKLKNMIGNMDFDSAVSNPVTDALGKKNWVNVPSETTVEFAKFVSDMQEEIKGLRREVQSISGNNIISSDMYGKVSGINVLKSNRFYGCGGNNDELMPTIYDANCVDIHPVTFELNEDGVLVSRESKETE